MLPGARVRGDLLYGDKKPRIAPGASVAGKVSDEGWADAANAPWGLIGALTLWLAVSVSALALGLVLIAVVPRAADAASRAAREELGSAIGWGALLFFGLPVVAVIALITLVGIPLGIGLLLALAPLGAIAYVTGCYIVGRRIASDASRSRRGSESFAGAILFSHYGVFERTLMRLIMRRKGHGDVKWDQEYTDWKAVDRFARDFASSVAARAA